MSFKCDGCDSEIIVGEHTPKQILSRYPHRISKEDGHEDLDLHLCTKCAFNEKILACSDCHSEWSFMDEPQDTMMDLNLPLELDCTSSEIEEVFTKPERAYSCPKCPTGIITIHKQCSCDGQVYPDN